MLYTGYNITKTELAYANDYLSLSLTTDRTGSATEGFTGGPCPSIGG